MQERRKSRRTQVDLTVRKHINGNIYFCRACEISAWGIRLRSGTAVVTGNLPVDIEVPLVEGKLVTTVVAKPIWNENDREAFEFQSPSLAQRIVLERLFGGSIH